MHIWLDLIARLLLAVLVGGIIGWNRHTLGKPAGLRTYMLLSLGSALFTVSILAISSISLPHATGRVTQVVATGIGFLGTGVIVQECASTSESEPIEGLTSAACVWVTGALGAIAACGLWQLAFIGLVLVMLILQGGRWAEQFISRW